MTSSAGMSLPMPDNLIPDLDAMGMISPAIRLTLQCIAQFTVMVRRQKIYLFKLTTFNELVDYHASNNIFNQRIHNDVALGHGKIPSGGNHKVSTFLVLKFIGDSLKGQAFIDNVVRKFKGYGQLSYLEDDQYCNNHLA